MVDSEIDTSVNIHESRYEIQKYLLSGYSRYSAVEAATEHGERAIL